ncbi:glycosyltransferase [Sphaerisporangium perillae]|uniref:glycosyltransferase n=1 Tax=Sphaerisporangium perillae TaxID=2935860 RepID=UPI00200D22DB|nr:glycosyltransferase [Sphaerisporangium perillae]
MRIIARMNVGGPARQVSSLCRHLDPARFEQRLYAGQVQEGEADYLDLCGSDLEARVVRGLGRSVHLLDDLGALVWLIREMRRFKPHIVHTHTAKAGALGRSAAILAGIPALVHTFHGHLLNGYFSPAKTRLVIGVERALATRAERLLSVGTQVRDDLIHHGIGRPDQYVLMPPGTTVGGIPDRSAARRTLGLPADPPVVAYVGRVTQIKRPDRFLAVARAVLAARRDTHFVVCGEGNLTALLHESVAEFGGALHILGWRPDTETVYAASDLVLLTSDNEGMPLSLIEAGMAGVPAVATRVGSVEEVVDHGHTGMLAAADVAELTDCVLRLLDDEPLREAMGVAARDWTARRFTVERLVADTEAVYTEIARAHGWWPGEATAAARPARSHDGKR